MKTAEPAAPKIDARNAVVAAMKYFKTLLPEHAPSLEEIEMSEDERHWLVTLGYVEQPTMSEAVLSPKIPGYVRRAGLKLKVFKVDAENGKVLSMKIR